MADCVGALDPIDCLDWATCTDCHESPHPDVAICSHDGCPWESTAKTVAVQFEAYIAHHECRHQD